MSRYSLTTNEKLEIIDYYEKEGPDIRELAERFNIGKTQAANILKNADRIREERKSEESKKTKYFSPQGKIIDTTVYDWYVKSVEENQPVSGKLIKEKALEIARNIDYNGFCASNGWLQRWRVRHNVSLKPVNPYESMGGNFHADFYNKHITNGINESRKNTWHPMHSNTHQTPFQSKHRRAENNFNSAVFGADDFDPLAFTEVSYGNGSNQGDDDDDDVILLENENENRFKIDCYATALNAIEDLKNFAQDDEFALEQLNKLEIHFQNERLK